MGRRGFSPRSLSYSQPHSHQAKTCSYSYCCPDSKTFMTNFQSHIPSLTGKKLSQRVLTNGQIGLDLDVLRNFHQVRGPIYCTLTQPSPIPRSFSRHSDPSLDISAEIHNLLLNLAISNQFLHFHARISKPMKRIPETPSNSEKCVL